MSTCKMTSREIFRPWDYEPEVKRSDLCLHHRHSPSPESSASANYHHSRLHHHHNQNHNNHYHDFLSSPLHSMSSLFNNTTITPVLMFVDGNNSFSSSFYHHPCDSGLSNSTTPSSTPTPTPTPTLSPTPKSPAIRTATASKSVEISVITSSFSTPTNSPTPTALTPSSTNGFTSPTTATLAPPSTIKTATPSTIKSITPSTTPSSKTSNTTNKSKTPATTATKPTASKPSAIRTASSSSKSVKISVITSSFSSPSNSPTPTTTLKTPLTNGFSAPTGAELATPSTNGFTTPTIATAPATFSTNKVTTPSFIPSNISNTINTATKTITTSSSQHRVRRRRFRSGLDMIRNSKGRKKAKQSNSVRNAKMFDSEITTEINNNQDDHVSNKKMKFNGDVIRKGNSTTKLRFDDASSSSPFNATPHTSSKANVHGCVGGLSLSSSPLSPSSISNVIKRTVVNKALGETVLHRAARQGYLHIVRYCLSSGTCDINARDNAGYTPLHECCSRGHLEIARALLEHGADVDPSATGGVRPLHDAVESDHIETVRILLSYGSDPTIATYTGSTPLKLARSSKMITFLRGVIYDLTGELPAHPDAERSDSLVPPWKFEGSSRFFDSPSSSGYDVFNEDSIPFDNIQNQGNETRNVEDDVDESNELSDLLFEMNDTPHLPTYRIKPGSAVSIVKPATKTTATSTSASTSSKSTSLSKKSTNSRLHNTSNNEDNSKSSKSSDMYTQNYLKLCDILKQLGLSKDQFLTKYKSIEILCLSTINLESNILTSWKSSSHHSSIEESSQLSELVCLDDSIREILGISTLRVP